jgi:predicted permease
MSTLTQDVRYAMRTLARAPTFTAVAVLTLALGIGANTAIFSVVYHTLLRPLPYPDPDRMVGLVLTYPGGRSQLNLSYDEFTRVRTAAPILQHVAVSTAVGFNLFTGTTAERVTGLHVSRDYFRVFGVTPALGREFHDDEDQPGGARVVVLSDALWKRRFGADRAVLGRTLSLDGIGHTVIGVMPPGFEAGVDVWATVAQVSRTIGGGQNLTVVGRLWPDQTLATTRVPFHAMATAWQRAFSRRFSPDSRIELASWHDLVVGDLRAPVRLLFGAIGFVLLIACANVANLMVGRAAARGRELSVRVALGATRRRLVRQLLTESVLVALAGGTVALLFAAWGLGALLSLVPGGLPGLDRIPLDGWAFLFTFGVSLVTGLAFGLLPAWRAARASPHDALQESGRRTAGSGRQSRLRSALVVAEVSLSLVLLVGAALLIRTLDNLLHTDPGFDPSGVVAAEIWLGGTRYDSTSAIAAFYDDVVRSAEALPGVAVAAVVEAGVPLQRGGNAYVLIEGVPEGRSVDYRAVTAGYRRALGIALTEGRWFSPADGPGAPRVAVVNGSFARRFLPGGALGRVVRIGGPASEPRQIIGVVRDVRSFIGDSPQPAVMIPAAQGSASTSRLFGSWFPTYVIARTTGDAATLPAGLDRVIRAADAEVPVGRIRSMDDLFHASLALQRFQTSLLAVFAALAVALAAVGIYGLMATMVTQRTREMGLRVALGAGPRQVERLIVGNAARLTLVGVAVGLAGAVALTRVLRSQLYGVAPTNPPSYVAATVVLGAIALLAAWLPARRAGRVDPMVALRSE